MNHLMNHCFLLALVVMPSLAVAADARESVLVQSASVVLTRADFDAELARIPPESRDAFASSAKRIEALLNSLLVTKTLASDARKDGLDKDSSVIRRIDLEADRVLAQFYLQRVEADAGAEFDRRLPDLQARALETYTVRTDRYRTAEQINASHILFSTKGRSPAEALILAQQAQARLAQGADFAALAREVSDDPSAAQNGGELGWFAAQAMDPAFSKAAFALPAAGAISAPILSNFGYHLIRLEGRRPARLRSFDEVKDEILAEMRKNYVARQREQRISAAREDATIKVNAPAIEALVKRVDPALFKVQPAPQVPR